MNIAALFIRRPVATVLIMLGMLFFGLASYRNLPVNQLPTVDFPTIQVQAELAGADPETMASSGLPATCFRIPCNIFGRKWFGSPLTLIPKAVKNSKKLRTRSPSGVSWTR